MSGRTTRYRLGVFAMCATFTVLVSTVALADENDPPTRVARLAYTEGSVSFQPAGTQDWVAAPLNRPLTTGDVLWSDQQSRAELQLDGSLLRLAAGTELSVLNLNDRVTQLQLSSGTLLIHIRRLDDDETYEIDTPNLAFSVLRVGTYRLTVDATGNTTLVSVIRGQGEVTGGGRAYTVYNNQNDSFSGQNPLIDNPQPSGPPEDDFAAWSASRDERWDHSPSARYVSPDVIGYQDLDDQGTWTATPDNGYVWFPRGVEADWAPYQRGHWAYIAPWGYTWVDDRPWGFAPFHYGRWISENGAWGWVPAPPRPQGEAYYRPVYAPALVAWVGVGAGVAWFALGPREVYCPSYPVSRGYVNQINVSNTTVNNTVINNVYNTTIINNKTVNNVTYVNRRVPGAVTATTSQAFTSAGAVARNRVPFDARAAANQPVRALAPAVVPTRQAVLGTARETTTRPPAPIQARQAVARLTPPPAAPAFDRRLEAIRDNGGKPLSVQQARQIAPPENARPRVMPAPAAATLVTNPAARAEPRREAPSAAPAPAPHPAPVIHPAEAPQQPRTPSPNEANSMLERQHLQEQQKMQQEQAAERQRVQQQQEQEHQRIAQQQADEGRRQQQQRAEQAQRQQQQQAEESHRQQQQQIEQQHQQQTQQLMQRQAEAQQQLQQRQEAQRQQQQVQARPPAPQPPPHRAEPNDRSH